MDKNVSMSKRIEYYSRKENVGKVGKKLFREIMGKTFFNLKDFHEIKLYNKQDFIVSSSDKGLSLDLFCFGIREESACEHFLSMLDKNDVVLDLGANIGYYVVQEARIVKKVIAVEPCKSSFSLLKNNVLLNVLSNVRCHNLAIGNENKLIDFYVYDCANVSSVVPLKEHGDFQIEKVFINTGKDFLARVQEYPNVLRMDVEGYELEILKSFKDELKQFDKLFFEVHTCFLGKQKVIELLELLEQNGFEKIGFMIDDKYTGKKEKVVYYSINVFKHLDFPECFHLFGVKN